MSDYRTRDTGSRETVVGLFHDTEQARDAVEALKQNGFGSDEIGILMRDRDRAKDLAQETGTEAGAGAATGAVGGGVLGGIAGWLVGAGLIAIPGIGPFLAAGALGTALAGAAIGAGVGAIAGALVGMGIPKEEAEYYENEVKGGRTLVTVRAKGRYNEARTILRRSGAYDIENREPDSAGRGTMSTGYTETGIDTGTGTTGTRGSTIGASSGSSTGNDWSGVSSGYRSRWQSRYGNQSGARWEDYEPGYRYGWEMSSRPEYRGKGWNEVEPAFRRDWSSRHSDKPWDRFGESIRDAWENVTDRPSSRSGMSTSFGERTDTGEHTIPLREEELEVQRHSRQTGEVRISKDVEEKRVSRDVPYTREEVHIERRPVSGEHVSDKPIGSDSETIRVPVHEEEIDVSKRTVTREELVIGKDQVQGEKRVEETLRREVPRVEKEGEVGNLEGLSEEERRRRGLGLTEEERRRRTERGPF